MAGAASAALTAGVVAAALAAGAPAASPDLGRVPHDPDKIPRLFDPRTRAPAPRFFNANGDAPQAKVPRFFDATARAIAADAAYKHPWAKRVAAATRYARDRRGRVAFAVIDEEGRLRGYLVNQIHRSASVVKAMFLVGYLDLGSVRSRSLRSADKGLLRPMIVRSDNNAATRVRNIEGAKAVYDVAKRVGMKRFTLKRAWGDTEITAADQAHLFAKIDRLVVARHRAYARKLLRSIGSSQRWGIAQAVPDDWTIFFKGGWRPLGGSWLENQSALLERDKRRVAIAVLTDSNPSSAYGRETERGVARRVLRGLR
jgi:hypothetical protein